MCAMLIFWGVADRPAGQRWTGEADFSPCNRISPKTSAASPFPKIPRRLGSRYTLCGYKNLAFLTSLIHSICLWGAFITPVAFQHLNSAIFGTRNLDINFLKTQLQRCQAKMLIDHVCDLIEAPGSATHTAHCRP